MLLDRCSWKLPGERGDFTSVTRPDFVQKLVTRLTGISAFGKSEKFQIVICSIIMYAKVYMSSNMMQVKSTVRCFQPIPPSCIEIVKQF